KDDLEQFCDVLSYNVNLDIFIIDSNMEVITATNDYKFYIGKIAKDSLLGNFVIKENEKIVVDDPMFFELCNMCPSKVLCHLEAVIGYPISYRGRTEGVIFLVAFTRKQKLYAIIEQKKLTLLMEKLVDYITSKINESHMINKIEDLNTQLNGIIQSIDSGIVAFDKEGNIIHVNSRAESLLKINFMCKHNINEIFENFPLKEVMQDGCSFKSYKLFGNNGETFVADITPFLSGDKCAGGVVTFQDIIEAHRVTKNYIGDNEDYDFDDIVGKSAVINEAIIKAKKLAISDLNVMIRGESGTGKEMFARSIHNNSPRRGKPFIPINCAAIPETLLESELFGYAEGAFTGGKRGGKPGKFELADGGTIFLDEIGDMPLHLQAKLLRVLEDKSVTRLGDIKPVRLDVRIISATNKNIEAMIASGEFRADLYYRIGVSQLYLPTLRERKEDIKMLADYFLRYYCNKLNKKIMGFKEDVMEVIMRYSYPGNIRELQNAIQYAVVMENSKYITKESLPHAFLNLNQGMSSDIKDTETKERDRLLKAINIFGYQNKEQIANYLGISRATLYRWIKKYMTENNINHGINNVI
ncbi:MAG: sigma 54-interacting transcriptional regulator, partial [Thermoanaerobacteraceae bacterium]|nr:sigma 54-interacting transcriptional regulator [Thermoanaerobacteraceae bacterium]